MEEEVNEPTIVFERVSRRFVIRHEKAQSFQDIWVRGFRRAGLTEELWALHDISFQVRKGETLGIIGRNGAGKSTILKLISRILQPTSGNIRVRGRGRVSALIELGAGFHPDLSGRDNIFLNASILGLSKKEINQKFDEIVSFSQLERFLDTPLKHYSSGMYMRLGFAVATAIDPDILLIDEVLAVGDEFFQQRCFERIRHLQERGTTILFVSHDPNAVGTLCDRVMWIEAGEMIKMGGPDEVLDAYHQAYGQQLHAVSRAGTRFGTGEATIERIAIIDEAGQDTLTPSSGSTVRILVDITFRNKALDPVFSLLVRWNNGLQPSDIYATNTLLQRQSTGLFDSGDRIEVEFRMKLPLLSGRYLLSPAIAYGDKDLYYEWWDNALEFQVVGPNKAHGVVDLDSDIIVRQEPSDGYSQSHSVG